MVDCLWLSRMHFLYPFTGLEDVQCTIAFRNHLHIAAWSKSIKQKMAHTVETTEFCRLSMQRVELQQLPNMLLHPSITCKVIISAVAADWQVVFVVSKNGMEGFVCTVLLLSRNLNFLTSRKKYPQPKTPTSRTLPGFQRRCISLVSISHLNYASGLLEASCSL